MQNHNFNRLEGSCPITLREHHIRTISYARDKISAGPIKLKIIYISSKHLVPDFPADTAQNGMMPRPLNNDRNNFCSCASSCQQHGEEDTVSHENVPLDELPDPSGKIAAFAAGDPENICHIETLKNKWRTMKR